MDEAKYKSLAWYPILAVGLSMVAFIMIKTARDAVFFQESGLYHLPKAYIWISIASIPAVVIHLKTIGRFGARRARIFVYCAAILIFLFIFPFVEVERKTLMTAVFVLVPTVFSALFAGAWLLAADLLEGANPVMLRWAYSRIGAGSMLGGILGGLIAGALSYSLEPKYFVASGALVLIVANLIIIKAHKQDPIPGKIKSDFKQEALGSEASENSDSTLGRPRHGWSVLREPYVLTILAISSLASLAALYIDFQFYAGATVTQNTNATFFASFYTIVNAVSLLLQLFVAPRLQARLGVGGALMLLPSALLGVSGIFSFWVIAQSHTVLKVTESGLKSSVHRSMWEQVYLPIEREKRERVKAMADGLFAHMSEGAASVILYIWLLRAHPTLDELRLTWISWSILLAVVLWIGLTFLLNKLGCSEIEPVEPMLRLPDS